ncbi:winged helix-turn-helix domain-containing protein [Serratia fonticola]|uniref:winged helix-turn-helix domain-containing protein n=1 Tax=Serratia fonticola TaxID=47917 RepID=UPI00192CFD21|nr:winged helix-turn-helix domain-containing protein [Serratia fonticola]MBL5825946.1 winged helix-turn-helix domain-containing protein [Serratia fonticola]
MKEVTYGYLLGDDVQIDIGLGAITRIFSSKKLNYYNTEAIFVGETSMNLLVYLLERAEYNVVFYNDILNDVWDVRGLVSSYKRLNQVIGDLREKLEYVGLPGDFILTVRGQGYKINSSHIKRLYTKVIKFDSDERSAQTL